MKLTQPRHFYSISLLNMWQRFSFYMLQAVLTLYMIQTLHTSAHEAFENFALTNSLLYLFPLFGGYIGDKMLSPRTCVTSGIFISVAGYFCLAIQNINFLYTGLACIIIGTGLFMPNIITMLSNLYSEKDPRRDSGFSLFYIFINIGGFLPPLIGAYLIYRFDWSAVFIFSGATMLFGMLLFQIQHFKPIKFELKPFIKACSTFLALSYCGLFLVVLEIMPRFIGDAVTLISILLGIYVIKKASSFKGRIRLRLFACLILIMFSIVFEVLYGQAGMSLTIFTQSNVERSLNGVALPTVVFRSLNPLFVIILGFLLAKIWIWLEKKKKNPTTPVKFGLGTILMGLGFVILPLALMFAGMKQISFWWIVLSYFLQSAGELLVSPIGLSMVSELSPESMIGLMIGVWYLVSALANVFAGQISEMTTVLPVSANIAATSKLYFHVFSWAGLSAMAIGLLILLISKKITAMSE